MPTPIKKGTLVPQQQRYVETWSPVSGVTRNYEYKGMDADRMRAAMTPWINAGCEARLVLSYDMAELEITDATGTYTLDGWQIQQSDLNTSCLYNPYNISAAINEHDKRTLAKYLAQAEDDWDTVYEHLQDTTNEAALKRLYTRMLGGNTHFLSSRYILRHTTNAPLYATGFNIADVNVDCIYPLSGLLSETQNTGYWWLPLPNTMATAINNFPFPPVIDYYQNGALKRGSSRATAANFRQEITTEYWFGQWSTDEYPMAT